MDASSHFIFIYFRIPPYQSDRKYTTKFLSCRRRPSNENRGILGYIMISRCPSSWTDSETAHACMSTNYSADPLTALPIVDMTTDVTYANTYCAMCHNTSRNLNLWNLWIANKRGHTPSLRDISKYRNDTIWEARPAGNAKKCIVTPLEARTRPETKNKQLCRKWYTSSRTRSSNTIF